MVSLNKKAIYKNVNYFLSSIGGLTLWVCDRLGGVGVFVIETAGTCLRRGVDIRKIIFQMNFVGVNTLGVVVLTGSTIGAVLAVHAFNALERFGGAQDQFIGPLIYLSMTREFGAYGRVNNAYRSCRISDGGRAWINENL